MKLHLGTTSRGDFKLPADAVTQTFAILAKRGVGKTYTASVMAEEMLKAGQPIIATDPTGAWWGLRSKYRVVIFGGEHADVPLEESAGEVIARSIVENRFPAIIDLSLFRKGQLIRFMTAFAETLYRLNREALHLFVDEADAVAPQGRSYGGDENRMLGAMEDIVRRGRKRGIGCTLITQRAAVLNKNVLTQCEVLVTLRLLHPRDIGAVEEWINVHAEPDQASDMIASLPSLPIGEAWFWSPGWADVFERVHVRERETFDSGATPKTGQTQRSPKHLEEIDIAALGEQIKATVEKAKADDPKALRARIAELERAAAGNAMAKVHSDPKAIDRAVAERDRHWHREVRKLATKITQYAGIAAKARSMLDGIQNGEHIPELPAPPSPAPQSQSAAGVGATKPERQPLAPRAGDTDLGKGEMRILTVIAQHSAGVTREQLTVLTGYKRSSRDTYLQRLRAAGLIDDGPSITATEPGIMALGDHYEPLPTGSELRDYWMQRLPEGERTIMEPLIQAYPDAIDREALSTATGYLRSSRDTYLQRLRSRRLIEIVGRGEVRASAELFS